MIRVILRVVKEGRTRSRVGKEEVHKGKCYVLEVCMILSAKQVTAEPSRNHSQADLKLGMKR